MLKRFESRYATDFPPRRPLKIFASDPLEPGSRISIDIQNEELQPGPIGSRVEVVDYDGERDAFYPAVDLDDPAILMRGGLDPVESDPRFHQQMVYAVAMKTVENFERALGRRLAFTTRRHGKLRVYPHAFYGANAFFDPKLNALLFGYFRADDENPGPNLPGQYVFTCLSHDIIAHELTHAIVDRLRRHFIEPSNRDVLAFHEGFADIVALFQHFSFEDMLRGHIQSERTQLHRSDLLVGLARQFGFATGAGMALRSAIGKPDLKLYDALIEPHRRGAVLVAAVFDAFFEIYQRRIRDLIRIATSGTGNLPDADLHPDLVGRVAEEASSAAQSVLTMCIRAFDYLPPVDITFGDFLRALITADYELAPRDAYGQREVMIEAFRKRGIFPEDVRSLALESLLLPEADETLPSFPVSLLGSLAIAAGSYTAGGLRRRTTTELSFESQYRVTLEEEEEFDDSKQEIAIQLHQYAQANAQHLGLDPARAVQVLGFHPVFRVGPDGQLAIELVAQFAQQDDSEKDQLGGIPHRGGTTVVAAADGSVRYVIAKPLASAPVSDSMKRQAEARLERQKAFIADCDWHDPRITWKDEGYMKTRMKRRGDLNMLCQGLY